MDFRETMTVLTIAAHSGHSPASRAAMTRLAALRQHHAAPDDDDWRELHQVADDILADLESPAPTSTRPAGEEDGA